MSDIQTTYTPPAEATAPAEPTAPAETTTDFSAHPVWGKALETVPDVLRGPGTPLYEAIQTSEREAQKAIESARGTDIPQDWRELAAEAQREGVSVEELAAAYQGQQALAKLLQNDPDAFVAELQGQVDALVKSGELTRREGAQVMQQANQAAAAAADGEQLYQSETERKLAELEQWKAQQEQAQQREALERQQREQAERIQREEEAASNAYFDTFDQEMKAAGFLAPDQSGVLKSTIPVETLQLIASTGAGLRDANPQLSNEQAIKQATTQVRKMIEAAGGKLGPAPAAQVPVIGASSSVPTNQVQQPTGQPRTMKERMEAALAEAMRGAGQG